jgi:hypothetical protein
MIYSRTCTSELRRHVLDSDSRCPSSLRPYYIIPYCTDCVILITVIILGSARVVAVVNTYKRLAKVDGRYPHWVAPYDCDTTTTNKDRFSLIFYQTFGQHQSIGPAIFELAEAAPVPNENDHDR